MFMSRDEIIDFREKNRKERLWFVDYWANYVKTHSDEDWSRQQNILINSVLESSREFRKAKK